MISPNAFHHCCDRFRQVSDEFGLTPYIRLSTNAMSSTDLTSSPLRDDVC